MSILLEYPYTLPTSTLTLPSPALSNIENLNLKTNVLRAMSGKAYSYKRTPVVYRLDYTFQNVDGCAGQVGELLVFLRTVRGDYLKLTDWNSIVWKAKLTTDPNEIASNSRTMNDYTLTLEGTKI